MIAGKEEESRLGLKRQQLHGCIVKVNYFHIYFMRLDGQLAPMCWKIFKKSPSPSHLLGFFGEFHLL